MDGVSAVRGQVFVSASKEGQNAPKPDSTSVTFGANTVSRLDIDLSAVGQTASVSGTVRASGSNAPVAGAEVTVTGSPVTNLDDDGKLLTDAEGNYMAIVEAVDLGGTVSVSVSKRGMTFVPASISGLPAHANSAISGIDFTGFVNATITGRVVAPGGGPLSGVAISATSTTVADLVVHDTTGVTGRFSLSVPFGGYTIAASLGNYTFDAPSAVTGWVRNTAPGQTVNFGSIQAKTAGAMNVQASRMRQESDGDATNGDESQRWAGTISVMYSSTPADIPERFNAPTYTIQTNTGTDGAWADATGTAVDDTEGNPIPGSFTIPVPTAANGGDGEFMVRVVTSADETTASTPPAPFADTSVTATVSAVDPMASGVGARRQATATSTEAAANGDFIQASWTAVTNGNSDFRVVAQVQSASYGAMVWVVLTDATDTDRAITSADISTDLSTNVALPAGEGGAITVTEAELAAAIKIAVEWVQGTADDTDDGPKWMRSAEVDLAARTSS